VFTETWLEDYSRLAAVAGNVGIILSFADMQPDGSLVTPILPPALKDIVKGRSGIELAIGGWGGSDAHAGIVEGWGKAAANAKGFADSVEAAIDTLHKQGGVDIGTKGNTNAGTVCLDPEDLDASVKSGMTRIVEELRNRKIRVTMAVPESPGDALAFDIPELVPMVSEWLPMPYDEGSLDDVVAITSGERTVRSVGAWISATGNQPGRVREPYINYGVKSFGVTASEVGGVLTKMAASSEATWDLPTDGTDVPGELTTWKQANGTVVSYMSPEMMCQTHAALSTRYPGLAGNFFWSAKGELRNRIAAVQG
jgi:hypothetical protein